MTFSLFGEKFTRYAGITRLMDDLNEGLRTPGAIMLGGGNPAQIPEMEAYFKQLCQEMLDQGKLTEALCNYDGPQGKDALLKALANLLRDELGWEISEQNIALTNGSQSAFFYLFNLFAGRYADGSRRRVLFPLAPEYIGYADAGLDEGLFVSAKPNIELLPDGQFKYHVDFEHLTIGDDIGMICVSRPTNPTGNVITDEELMKLDLLAQQRDIPLVIDNAYGVPFPGIIFSDATPLWNPNTILCMSLSKLGLDHVDLYLIHWPANVKYGDAYVEAWNALQEFKSEGLTRSIGVSNFKTEHLDAIEGATPSVDQIEMHPSFNQASFRKVLADRGINPEAWSPLGQSKDLDTPVLADISRATGKSPAQVVIRWHLQIGNIVFPKSVTPSRIVENFDVFDFELSDDQIAAIDGLDRGNRIGGDPATADF